MWMKQQRVELVMERSGVFAGMLELITHDIQKVVYDCTDRINNRDNEAVAPADADIGILEDITDTIETEILPVLAACLVRVDPTKKSEYEEWLTDDSK